MDQAKNLGEMWNISLFFKVEATFVLEKPCQGLTIASGKSVHLATGAQASNIFWQVSGSRALVAFFWPEYSRFGYFDQITLPAQIVPCEEAEKTGCGLFQG